MNINFCNFYHYNLYSSLSLSQQGRVLGRLRGVRRRGGDDGAAEAVHGLAARLLLRTIEDGEPSRAGLPPPAAPARSVPRDARPLPAPISQGGAGSCPLIFGQWQ